MKFSRKINNTDEKIKDEFKSVLHKLAELTNHTFPKAQALPYSNPKLPIYSQLPIQTKIRVLNETKEYLNTWLSLTSENYDLKQEKQFLWRVLQNCGHRLGANSLDMFDSDEIVEVYALNGTHIWYNLRYMEICSHSIEEIRCIPWSQRYKRLPLIDQYCHEIIGTTLTQSSDEYRPCNIPEHTVEEVESSQLLVININFQNIAPIYNLNTNKKSGFIVTSKCDLILANRSNEEVARIQLNLASKEKRHLYLADNLDH